MAEPTIAGLVGQRVRAIRDASGRSQDELASAARRVGLDWKRASVAALETGRRGLSVEEFLLLPLALRELDDQNHTLVELLQGAKVTRTPGGGVSAGFLRSLVRGGNTATMSRRVFGKRAPEDVIASEATREAERHAARVLGVPAETIATTARQLWGFGLTEQRELRVAERGLGGGSSGTPQAIRGHVTRELLNELQRVLDEKEDDHG